MSKHGVGRGGPPVSGQCQIQPAACAVARDRRKHRGGELFQRTHQLLPILENSQADGPSKVAISASSAPAEKNFVFP